MDLSSLTQYAPEFSPPEWIVNHLRSRAGDFRVLPAVANEALRIANDPDSSMREFSSVIERDAKLSTDLLRIANSIIYAGSWPVVTVHQASVRLGLTKCRQLIYSSSITSLMRKITNDLESVTETLWKHSFMTGIASTLLDRYFDAGFQGEEFTGGLIHDIGRTLLAVSCPESFPEADPMDFRESERTPAVEDEILGTDHCVVGAWFALENNLPIELVEVIGYHHRPNASERFRRLVALVATADHMANHLQRGEPIEDYDPAGNPGIPILESTGLTYAGQKFSEQAGPLLKKVLSEAEQPHWF